WTYSIEETIPLRHYQTGTKKAKVKDGGAMASDGSVLYAIKGGGSHQFWKYTPGAPGIWTGLDTIPRLHNKSVPKTGAAMAYANGRVYLLKGNKTPEFWQYGITEENSKLITQNSNLNIATENSKLPAPNSKLIEINPNPFSKFTTINYTVSVSGRVSIKLYNASGRLIETFTDEYLNAGTYTTRLSAKSLARGIYFLKYEDATNSSEVKLIVQ
ncbi:MAG: T9SS type A sorting domain-containing protein, partial [candidate division WOR-3 bacterium]|nr:T9SS type A sorting domain-containing protein [candidate division WOR-3 bacterium]